MLSNFLVLILLFSNQSNSRLQYLSFICQEVLGSRLKPGHSKDPFLQMLSKSVFTDVKCMHTVYQDMNTEEELETNITWKHLSCLFLLLFDKFHQGFFCCCCCWSSLLNFPWQKEAHAFKTFVLPKMYTFFSLSHHLILFLL